jgi:hypothetical protein
VPPIGLPLLHEDEVQAVVSPVFLGIRTRMPFVPALFKALAQDPETLVAARLQARAVHDDPRSPAAANAIPGSARTGIHYRPGRRLREILFGTDLGFSPDFAPETIDDVETVVRHEADRRAVYEHNSTRVARLHDTATASRTT